MDDCADFGEMVDVWGILVDLGNLKNIFVIGNSFFPIDFFLFYQLNV